MTKQPFPMRHVSRRTLMRTVAASALLLPYAGRSSTATAQELSGKITVSFEGSDVTLAPIVEKNAQAIMTAHDGVEIEVKQAPGGNFATQLFLALSTNRGPDVFALTGLGIGELSAAGFLEPLDSRLANWDGWSQFPEIVRRSITFQNSVWALPVELDTHFLYYRKDLFEQAGIPREWAPETPEDILAAARQLKTSLPDIIPYAIYSGANGGNATPVRGFLPILFAYGGDLTDETGKWIIDSCAVRRTLEYYATAYQIDQTVPQQVMTAADPQSTMRDAFGNGELGIVFDGSWAYGQWLANDEADTTENIGYVLHPAADGRPPFTVGGVGTCWYINAQSKNKDLAWAFVQSMVSREDIVAINLADPHVPSRDDAASDPAFQANPFLADMIDTLAAMQIRPPDPAYRNLIGIVQNATGIVATGEATPEEAVARYAQDLTAVLGSENVVAQPCPS